MQRFFTVKEIMEAARRFGRKRKAYIEMDEQESVDTMPEAPKSEPTPEKGSETQTNVKKWESGATRGKANPIDDKKKWESGINRGKANPIDDTKKWESGITRGKANPIN